MSTRILSGLAIVLAIAAGGHLPGCSSNQEQSSAPESSGADAAAGNDPFITEIGSVAADDAGSRRELPDPETDDEVLTVRITDENYYIARTHGKSREYHAATLEEVVSAAQDRPGNDQGVRVRIIGKQASKSPGGRELQDALTSAGIDATAIDWGTRTR